MTLPIPEYIFDSYADVTPEWLGQRGLKAIAADLDNTLAKYSQPLPAKETLDWVRELKSAGVQIGIVSNNHDIERVRKHAQALGVPYICPAKKPSPHGLLSLAAMLGVKPEDMAVIGDQIFTDVLAALRAGMTPIKVKPLSAGLASVARFPFEWPFIHTAKRRSGK